jgi:hypothetical protein
MGGEAGQGWVMARQALAKDASSERNFIAMEGMGLTSRRQCRGARNGVRRGLCAVELRLEQLGMGAVLTVDGTGTLPSLVSPLSFPDLPFSFLYFPSLPQAEFTALYGDGALEEARRLREGNWASVRTVLTGAVALGALVTVGAFFASK